MIIFLGIAGSGKTEQSILLAKQFDFDRISVGELLRNITDESIKDQLNEGDLIDDSVVISVLEKALGEIPTDKEFIIDGFPRTIQEATWISNREPNDIIVIHLLLNPSIAIARLKMRNRPDDNTDAIAKRINEYNKLIEPILSIFNSKGVQICEVEGSQGISEVHEEIVKCVEEDEKRVS